METVAVSLFCLLAILRIGLYSAAFPFFSNIDEQVHFDTVLKYSHGHIPRGLEPISSEAANYIVFFGTYEYFKAPSDFPNGQIPPPAWKDGSPGLVEQLLADKQVWESRRNFESSQPPLYYAVTATWWHIGKLFRLEQGDLLYWTRFLNAVLGAIVVYLGYLATRGVFTDAPTRLSVPMLLAFIPQDAFYSIENDVLSPITFGLGFIGLLRVLQSPAPSATLLGATGLGIAAAYLTKISNLPLVVTACAVVILKLWHGRDAKTPNHNISKLITFVACAAIPIAAWVIRTKTFYGDFTGSADKIKLLDWTPKLFGDWWPHPIFTPTGFWTFFSETMASFWRGEFMWHKQTLAISAMDYLYVFSSIFLIAFALLKRSETDRTCTAQRHIILVSLGLVLSAVMFLGLLSLQFDFGRCVNPSRSHPYFVAGRLMSGAMIPFAILYIAGLERLLRPFHRRWVVLVATTAIVIAITVSEAAINLPAFYSQYNWFHLP